MAEKIEIIAEVGINHGGSFLKATEMVIQASKTGADTVKFQLVDPNFYEKDSELYNIFKQCFLPIEDHIELKKLAEEYGLNYLCTPSDLNMAKLLIEKVGVKRLKIASDSAKDPELLRYIGKNKIGAIISTGHIESASELLELMVRYKLFQEELTFLHCVSKYPCPEEDANLPKIKELINMIPTKIGYSDHTKSIIAPVIALAWGASLIEKHFKIDEDCVDAPLSLNVNEFTQMVKLIREAEKFL